MYYFPLCNLTFPLNTATQISQTIVPAPSTTVPYPEATNITVGLSYYLLARFLPAGTHVIWGLNLAQNNLTAAFLEAQALHAAFQSEEVRSKGVTLDFVEIGNEPDLYSNNGARSAATWSIEEYVRE